MQTFYTTLSAHKIKYDNLLVGCPFMKTLTPSSIVLRVVSDSTRNQQQYLKMATKSEKKEDTKTAQRHSVDQ